MGFAAVVLVAVSALMHAGWNAASRKRSPPAAFFLVANTAGVLCLLPVLMARPARLLEIPPVVWVLLPLTGVSMALYYAALAGAYRAGQMSVAYPVARSLPVVAVAGAERLLGLGGPVGGLAFGGMLLVVGGCLLAPRDGFPRPGARSRLDPSFALALLTALGISGYSLIDHEALAALRAASPGLGPFGSTLLYAPLEALSASFFLGLYVLANPAERTALARIVRQEKMPSFSTGIVIYLTYMLVLVAMGLASNASYVVAFRQLSVPVGAFLGVVALGEPARWPKAAGVALIFVGLCLVAAGS